MIEFIMRMSQMLEQYQNDLRVAAELCNVRRNDFPSFFIITSCMLHKSNLYFHVMKMKNYD